MIDKRVKYYKVVNNKFIAINPCDYIIKFYCGGLHWINITTGEEEKLFTKLEEDKITLKKNIMEIETQVFFQDEATEIVEWKPFTTNLNDILAYYEIADGVTRIVMGIGEFDIAIPYDQLKKLKEIAYHHKNIIQFN